MRKAKGRRRVAIFGVTPEIDGGRHPIKRVVGEEVVVAADIVADGHDMVTGVLLHRKDGQRRWQRTPLTALGNDRYEASFTVEEAGRYKYSIQARVDAFRTWRRDLEKRVAAGQDVAVDLLLGADLVAAAATRGKGKMRTALESAAEALSSNAHPDERVAAALSDYLLARMDEQPDLSQAVTYGVELRVTVDRERAGCSAWYEVFPRSTSKEPGKHGTFRDLAEHLDYIAGLGFDVVYLPPIHPVGLTHRKGKNNNPVGAPGDTGSPWAIGGAEGGHTAVHPDLGTPADFREVVARARGLGMEIALDLAFQCSPDHPWAKEHPEWFRSRPDGTIQYAENPPKKYEDIYPLNFDTPDWEALWEELRNVVLHWAGEGVAIFRVDNPHTKSFRFWEWLIETVKQDHPEVLFLAEAFTRPKVMYHLAKIGFTWSYTYFTWRDTGPEFTEYLTELTSTEVAEFFRPNFWPNTPDILPAHLVTGGRPMFLTRLLLAATLSSNYGIYGPAFELIEREPREPGSEEYLDSEKYELKVRDLEATQSIAREIALVNRIRRENPALQQTRDLHFHRTTNEQLLCYSKRSPDGESTVLVVVNLEPRYVHSGWLELDLGPLGLAEGRAFAVHDLLDGSRYEWEGPRNFVELNPRGRFAHVFAVGPAEES